MIDEVQGMPTENALASIMPLWDNVWNPSEARKPPLKDSHQQVRLSYIGHANCNSL
jgi:hypothetical protein